MKSDFFTIYYLVKKKILGMILWYYLLFLSVTVAIFVLASIPIFNRNVVALIGGFYLFGMVLTNLFVIVI